MLQITAEGRERLIAQALDDADDARSMLALIIDEAARTLHDSHPAIAGALRAADRGIGSALGELRASIGEGR